MMALSAAYSLVNLKARSFEDRFILILLLSFSEKCITFFSGIIPVEVMQLCIHRLVIATFRQHDLLRIIRLEKTITSRVENQFFKGKIAVGQNKFHGVIMVTNP